MNDPIEIAVARFKQRFSCTQSVFSAIGDQHGFDTELAMKIGSPFGGGLVFHGHVCGAVSGALMALGLVHGAMDRESKTKIYDLAEQFLDEFEKQHGTILCRELINCDLRTPEGWKDHEDRNVRENICQHLVEDATEIATRLIKQA